MKAEKLFFPSSVLAQVLDVDKSTVRRRAERENLPHRRQGNRDEFCPPRAVCRRCKGLSPASPIFDQARAMRELHRCAAVLGFLLELERNPRRGIERALKRTSSNFRHLMRFTPMSLRRWVTAVKRRGLAGLMERKVGVVGCKSARLERILAGKKIQKGEGKS